MSSDNKISWRPIAGRGLHPQHSARRRVAAAADEQRKARVTVMQPRKRNHGISQKLLQPINLNPRKRADCVVREARCVAGPGAVRTALQQAVAVEIERMRALHESEEAIRMFQAATEVHIALCEREPREHEAPAHDRPPAEGGATAAQAQAPSAAS